MRTPTRRRGPSFRDIAPTTLLLGLALAAGAGCASLKTIAKEAGTIASTAIDEAAADTSSNRRRALGKAAERAAKTHTGDTLTRDQRSQLAAQRESQMSCNYTEYDQYFADMFKQYASAKSSPAAAGRVAQAAERAGRRALGTVLRVCGEMTDRVLAGEEPFQGTNTVERAAMLLRKDRADYRELQREYEAFRAWMREVRDVR